MLAEFGVVHDHYTMWDSSRSGSADEPRCLLVFLTEEVVDEVHNKDRDTAGRSIMQGLREYPQL